MIDISEKFIEFIFWKKKFIKFDIFEHDYFFNLVGM
jgi:hypothetical protein